jgi:hypothetical protein
MCLDLYEKVECLQNKYCGWLGEGLGEFGTCVGWTGAADSEDGAALYQTCDQWKAVVAQEAAMEGVPLLPECPLPTAAGQVGAPVAADVPAGVAGIPQLTSPGAPLYNIICQKQGMPNPVLDLNTNGLGMKGVPMNQKMEDSAQFHVSLVPGREAEKELFITFKRFSANQDKFLSSGSQGLEVKGAMHDDTQGRERWKIQPVPDMAGVFHIVIVGGVETNRKYLAMKENGNALRLIAQDELGKGYAQWVLAPVGNAPPINAATMIYVPPTAPPAAPTQPPCPELGKASTANWWSTLDKSGWAEVNGLINGLWRNDCNDLFCIEEAYYTPIEGTQGFETKIVDITIPFDNQGWVECPAGYFMSGVFNSADWPNSISKLEKLKCVKPLETPVEYMAIRRENWWSKFDNKGWAKCPKGAFMTGMFRSACDKVSCIEEVKCAQLITPQGCPMIDAPPMPPPKKCPSIANAPEQTANWWGSFDRQGWSTVPQFGVIVGFFRNGCNELYCLEEAKYKTVAETAHWDCYNHNHWGSFDRRGMQTCNAGYFVNGLFRTGGHKLFNIEEFKCCRGESWEKTKNGCVVANWWGSFDRQGVSRCPEGKALTGLMRNDCNELYCLEEAECCDIPNSQGCVP